MPGIGDPLGLCGKSGDGQPSVGAGSNTGSVVSSSETACLWVSVRRAEVLVDSTTGPGSKERLYDLVGIVSLRSLKFDRARQVLLGC